MTKREFVARRSQAWKRFGQLLNDLGRSNRRLTSEELGEFSRLFREVCYDLSIIRSRDWGLGLVTFLNDLVTRGHNVYYRAPPGNLANVTQFLAVEFPRTFRRYASYFLTGCLLFFGPFAIAWVIVQKVPGAVDYVLPKMHQQAMAEMYKNDADADPWQGSLGGGFGDQRSGMFGFYIMNNVGIAFRAFALGILLGIPTVYILVYNGIVIGATFGYLLSLSAGHTQKLLSFIISHGSFELTAIAVAGGAGLMLGDAILHPGQRPRWEALKVQGLAAIQIALGAGAMLAVAALIEAFWSPAPIPAELKYGVGAGLWLLVAAYLAFAGVDFTRA